MLSQGEVLPDEIDVEEELAATEGALLDPSPVAIAEEPAEVEE